MLKKLNTLALILLITGSIDSIRNFPTSALFGSTLIFFFIFSALIFLIPTALVSAELAANVDEGGIYQWVRLAFGERLGFFAVWLQWVNNIFWFPTILSFLAGTASYLINPELAQNKFYLISVILIIFWSITLLNLKGIRLSAKFTSFCTVAGLFIPMVCIIVLLLTWLILGKPLQIHLTASNMFPSWNSSENWIALTAIMLSFAGMELATVHVNDVDQPRKTFPKALTYSTFIILITMILGSLAIAFVLPYDKINLVDGTIQTFHFFLAAYGLDWLTPLFSVLLIIGCVGSIISWVISPIKGLGQAAQHGFLPPVLQKVNKHGVAQNLLITQGVLVSLFCMTFLLFPSVNASYWLLTALTTQLYVLMYVLMFLAAIRLRLKIKYSADTFSIPGKTIGRWLVYILGLFGCGITLIVGFIPPTHLNIGSAWYYELIFCLGMLSMTLPILFFFRYAKRNSFPLKEAMEPETLSID